MKNKFCVIADKGIGTPVKRTWLPTKEEAEGHAQRLLRKQPNEPGAALYVVEVVSVVGKAQPKFDVFTPEQYGEIDSDD